MRGARIAGLAILAVLSISCTQAKKPSGHISPSSSPATESPSAPSSSRPLIAMVTTSTRSPELDTVHFLTLAGREIRSVTLPITSCFRIITAGGTQVFFTDGRKLKSVDSSGHLAIHGSLMEGAGCPRESEVRSLAVSPDGRRWIWNVVHQNKDQSETTKLYLDGVGLEPKMILNETAPAGNPHSVDPVFWSQGGIALADLGFGLGGLVFFSDSYWYPTRRLDPNTLDISALSQTDRCFLTDLVINGSWACIGRSDSKSIIELHRADGSLQRLAIKQAGEQFGNALIGLDPETITYGVFAGTRKNDYILATYRVDLKTGSASRIGSDGDIPEALLPDGSLILSDADFAHPRQRTTKLSPDGSVVQLGSGDFIGYLSETGSVSHR
jgi:hypothetical protein